MRYAILIPDGAADQPFAGLGNRTALEAAHIPGMDRLARDGWLGLAATVPPGMKPGSDVANLSVLGYDPSQCYTGRAPLEAAAMGVELKPGEAVFRANTVTVSQGIMRDYSAGHISTAESRAMVGRLAGELGISGVKLYPGISYRHLCVMQDMAGNIPGRTPPHDIIDKPVDAHQPRGELAGRLVEVEARSMELLAGYPENQMRRETGKPMVTQLWLWGGGVMPSLRSFEELYGLRGGVISAVDLLKGIGKLAGLEVIEVQGATGYYDTDYAAKAEAALEFLGRGDLVLIHVEAPDEAGHNGHAREKVRALESIDSLILQPLLAEADAKGDLRILCMPDHPTPLEIRTHTGAPVPFAMWGPGIRPEGAERFTEAAAAQPAVDPVQAHDLIRMLQQHGH